MADRWRVETAPDPGDVQFLEDRIYDFNVEATGIADGELLAIFDRDGDGRIVAGLFGWTWGRCCEVRDLWVAAERRGRGTGAALLALAEAEAGRRGCDQVVLATHTFQAPDFYRARGYEVIGSVDGYPTGHGQLYLRKTLASPPT